MRRATGADDAAVAAVVHLHIKASELYGERLHSRAADKYAAAARAAAAAQPGDNAVVAIMQARQVLALLADAYDFFNTAAALHAARTQVAPLLRAAMGVAQRRSAAGTLRTGMCTAFEEAYVTAKTLAVYNKPNSVANGLSTAEKRRSAEMCAPHVGYYAYMTVASAAVSFFALAVHHEDDDFCAMHAALITDMYAFIASGLNAMRSAKLPDGMVLPPEKDVVRLLRKCIEEDLSIRDDMAAAQELLAAWRALQRSGVLVARSIAACAEADDRSFSAAPRVAVISAATRRCALAACNEPEYVTRQFKSCAACRGVVYCCKEHQTADWPSHKAACKAARKAQAAAEESGAAGPSSTGGGASRGAPSR